MSPPLTLDKLKDKRFYETEKAIFQSVTKEGTEEIGKILIAAKISRATFYRHHGAVYLIERDYEELVGAWVRGLVEDGEKSVEDSKGLRKIYFDMLVFIYKNRELFQYFLARENMRVYNILMREVGPVVLGVWRARWMEAVYDIYAGEVVGVLIRWGMGGHEEGEMMRVLDDIMYLTETAKERLGRFVR